jgi:cell division protein FtsL
MSQERHSLPTVIIKDLLGNSKLPLLLLLAVVASALLVVYITHQTRLITAQNQQLLMDRDDLDVEWRNLILEENALGDHSRIERIAIEKLHMQHVDPAKEQIVIKP